MLKYTTEYFKNANLLKLLKDKEAATDFEGNYSQNELLALISSVRRYLVRRISTVHSILPFYLYFPSFALNASAYIRICFTIDSNPLLRVGDK